MQIKSKTIIKMTNLITKFQKIKVIIRINFKLKMNNKVIKKNYIVTNKNKKKKKILQTNK